jgi:hypothetical protein
MRDEAEREHYRADTLLEYFEMMLSEDEQLAVEEHLDGCARCLAVAGETQRAAAMLDGWTAQAHGEAYLAVQLQSALAAAQARTVDASWQARLARWRERWAGAVEAAVRVVVEAPGQASRIVTEGLDTLARPGTSWQFALAPAPVPTRGLLGRGAVPPPPAVAVSSIEGAGQARVAVGGDRREVVVRVDGVSVGWPLPLVLLVPLTGGEPRLALPEPQPNVDYAIARFDDVAPGQYVVAFEPAPDA